MRHINAKILTKFPFTEKCLLNPDLWNTANVIIRLMFIVFYMYINFKIKNIYLK